METMNKKKKYVSPVLEVVHIEMEEGIAGGSATSGTPEVEGFGSGTGSNGWSDDSQF